MEAPISFVSALKREFPDLRIRFSQTRQSWLIEQQVGRGALLPIRLDPHDDGLIRARDGYWLTAEVRPGDTMPCPICNLTLKVPILEFREVKCKRCQLAGRDGRVMAGYFPLGELLLEHLRMTDPLKGGTERMAMEADLANARRDLQRRRDLSNHNESAAKDAFNRIAGIPQVGWTGNNPNIHMSKEIT